MMFDIFRLIRISQYNIDKDTRIREMNYLWRKWKTKDKIKNLDFLDKNVIFDHFKFVQKLRFVLPKNKRQCKKEISIKNLNEQKELRKLKRHLKNNYYNEISNNNIKNFIDPSCNLNQNNYMVNEDIIDGYYFHKRNPYINSNNDFHIVNRYENNDLERFYNMNGYLFNDHYVYNEYPYYNPYYTNDKENVKSLNYNYELYENYDYSKKDENVIKNTKKKKNEIFCSICGATETPVWRKLNNNKVCNACGLYFKSERRKKSNKKVLDNEKYLHFNN